MAELTVQEITRSGLDPTLVPASAGGDTVQNGALEGRVYLRVNNTDASAHEVQVDSIEQCNQGFDHNVNVSVPAGEERLIGPFPRDRFGDPLAVSYPTGVTSLEIAAIKLTK